MVVVDLCRCCWLLYFLWYDISINISRHKKIKYHRTSLPPQNNYYYTLHVEQKIRRKNLLRTARNFFVAKQAAGTKRSPRPPSIFCSINVQTLYGVFNEFEFVCLSPAWWGVCCGCLQQQQQQQQWNTPSWPWPWRWIISVALYRESTRRNQPWC